MRGLVALIICIASCALHGCSVGRGRVTIHPLSEVTQPVFCLPGPRPIKWLKISTSDETVWALVYAPEAAPDPPPQPPTLSDLVQPPAAAAISVRPFSCITYGRAPPGYTEKAPAAPLIPGKWYSALVDYRGAGHAYPAYLRFIIRADSSDKPIKLEYRSPLSHDKRIHRITNLNTTEVTN